MIMQISAGKRRFMGILTGLAILALPHGVPGQNKGQDKGQDKALDKKSDSSDNIKFDSVDGAELRGTFYPASKAKAPAALYDLSDAIDVDQLFSEFRIFAIALLAVTVAAAAITLGACHPVPSLKLQAALSGYRISPEDVPVDDGLAAEEA